MATYPSGTYAPTPVANGGFIDAARDNAQDAEITAIEDALRNGITHAVTFSTTVTMASDVNVTGTLNAVVPAVKVTHSADQAVAITTWTGLSWDTEAVDNAGMHSTSANSSRITFAHSTGLYAVGASIEWNPSTSGDRFIRLMLNDATGICALAVKCSSVAVLQFPQAISGLVQVTSTTAYATVQVLQNSASTCSITNSTSYGTTFWAHKVSR